MSENTKPNKYMTFAAHLVVRKNGNQYLAGFASKTPGQTVKSFGKWYGSQMSYRPFAAAQKAAEAMAEKLNQEAA